MWIFLATTLFRLRHKPNSVVSIVPGGYCLNSEKIFTRRVGVFYNFANSFWNCIKCRSFKYSLISIKFFLNFTMASPKRAGKRQHENCVFIRIWFYAFISRGPTSQNRITLNGHCLMVVWHWEVGAWLIIYHTSVYQRSTTA